MNSVELQRRLKCPFSTAFGVVSKLIKLLHFILVLLSMNVINFLIQQSGCRYESEVKAYLQKEDVVGCEEYGTLAKPACEKNPRQKRSKPRLVGRDASRSVSKTNLDKKGQAGPSSRTLLKNKLKSDCGATKEGLNVFRSNCDNLATTDDPDVAMQTDVNEHFETKLSREDELHSSPEHTETSTHTSPQHLEEMFYLPKWHVCQKHYNSSQSAEGLEIILANVKRLLSRSPPECLDLHCSLNLTEPAHFDESAEICSSQREDVDHFQVNFNLAEEENSLDSDSLDCNIAGTPPESAVLPNKAVPAGPDSTANSPSWDEVFDDVMDDQADKNTDLHLESKIPLASLDESIDLFDDDEAFLQISLPNLQTPNKDPDQRKQVPQNVVDTSNILNGEESSVNPKLLGPKAPSEQKSATFNYSQDMFPVNFDLGFSFDSEEEETAEPASDWTTEPKANRDQMYISGTSNKPNTSTNSFTLGHMSTPRVCPVDKTLPSLIAKSNLSPIITERESLVRANASTPALGFVSPNRKNQELFPKVLNSQGQPRGTGNRLCRRSLLDAKKPVNGDHASSGQLRNFFFVVVTNEIYLQCLSVFAV